MEERPLASWEKDDDADPRAPRCGRCGAATRVGDVRCNVCGKPLLFPRRLTPKAPERSGR
jgi:hypothetical protein